MATKKPKQKRVLPRTISLRWLQRKGACLEARRLFKELFGTNAALTTANIRKFVKAAGSNGRQSQEWLLGTLLNNLPMDSPGHKAQCIYCEGSTRKAMAFIKQQEQLD